MKFFCPKFKKFFYQLSYPPKCGFSVSDFVAILSFAVASFKYLQPLALELKSLTLIFNWSLEVVPPYRPLGYESNALLLSYPGILVHLTGLEPARTSPTSTSTMRVYHSTTGAYTVRSSPGSALLHKKGKILPDTSKSVQIKSLREDLVTSPRRTAHDR